MTAQDRISRQERRGKFFGVKWFIIAALVILLVVLAIYRFRGPERDTPQPTVSSKPKMLFDLRAISDSLITGCYQSFLLSDDIHFESRTEQRPGFSARSYRFYRQGWPRELPLIMLAQRLTEMASERGVSCDCLESTKDDWLECALWADSLIGGKIRLTSDRQTKLANRELAIVFDNFQAIERDDLKRLIRAGYTFGYISALDTSIPDDLRKLFSRAAITPVLSLPAGKERWRQLAQRYRLVKGTGKVKRASAFEFSREMVAEAFARQEKAKILALDYSEGGDFEVISAIFDEAKRARMQYLIIGKGHHPQDTLAISKGLTVLRLEATTINGPRTTAELKLDLIGPMISRHCQKKRALLLDGSQVEVDKLMNIKEMLNRLGIRVRPCLKLAQPVNDL